MSTTPEETKGRVAYLRMLAADEAISRANAHVLTSTAACLADLASELAATKAARPMACIGDVTEPGSACGWVGQESATVEGRCPVCGGMFDRAEKVLLKRAEAAESRLGEVLGALEKIRTTCHSAYDFAVAILDLIRSMAARRPDR